MAKSSAPKKTHSLSGQIRTRKNHPVPGLTIKAYDKKAGRRLWGLGKGRTNEKGYYAIDYTKKVTEAMEGQGADLLIRVYGAGNKLIAESPVLVNAPQEARINLSVPNEVYRGPSEFERLQVAIEGLVEPEKLILLNPEDISYLAAKLKLARANLDRYRHALVLTDELSKQTAPSTTYSALFYALITEGEFPSLKDLIYTDRDSIKKQLETAKKQHIIGSSYSSITKLVIAFKKLVLKNAKNGEPDKNNFNAGRLLKSYKGLGSSAQDKFLALFIDNPERKALWEKTDKDSTLKTHSKKIKDLFFLSDISKQNYSLIESVQKEFEDTQKKNINEPQDLAKRNKTDWVHFLTQNKDIDWEGKNDPQNPVTEEDFAKTLTGTFRKEFPMMAFSYELKRNGENPKDTVLGTDFETIARSHGDLLVGKVPVDKFWFESEVHDDYKKKIAKAKGEAKQNLIQKEKEFKSQLKGWQRLYKLVPEGLDKIENVLILGSMETEVVFIDENKKPTNIRSRIKEAFNNKLPLKNGNVDVQKVLDEAGLFTSGLIKKNVKLDSAAKIASQHKGDFVEKYKEAFSTFYGEGENKQRIKEIENQAIKIFDKAEDTVFGMLNQAYVHAPALEQVNTGVVARSSISCDPEEIPGDYRSLLTANLATLFGNQNFCESEHCQSILSPAAYLVELLESLPEKVKKNLFARRPDIESLHLNCRNTETKLLQIDLANELLERSLYVLETIFEAFLNKEPYFDYDSVSTFYDLQSNLSEEELAFTPENQIEKVYIILSRTYFPFFIPWDKWFEEAQLYLAYMDVELYSLLEVFAPIPLDNLRESQYWLRRKRQLNDTSGNIFRAHLGLNESSCKLITENAPANLKAIYGLDPFCNMDEFDMVPVLMTRLGLWIETKEKNLDEEEFILIRQLLGTRYIQDSHKNSEPLPGQTDTYIYLAFPPNCCDPYQARIQNLTKDSFIRISKFETLRHTLGWSVLELHHAIMVYYDMYEEYDTKEVPGNLSKGFVEFCSHIVRLKENNEKFSILKLLTFFGPMHTGAGLTLLSPEYSFESGNAGISLYEKIFLDRSLFNSPEDSDQVGKRKFFVLNDKRTELASQNESIENFAGIISSALGISEDEVLELIHNPDGKYPIDISGNLSLKNLSALYRVVELANYLSISIKDLSRGYQILPDYFHPFHIRSGYLLKSEQTLLFIEGIREIQQSPFSFQDVGYLWFGFIEHETETIFIKKQIKDFLENKLGPALQNINEEIGSSNFEKTFAAELSQSLSEFLNLPLKITHALLTTILYRAPRKDIENVSDIKKDSILLDFSSWLEGKSHAVSKLENHIQRMMSISQLVNEWQLTLEEIAYIDAYKNRWSSLDWNGVHIPFKKLSPTFEQWSSLNRYVIMRNKWSQVPGDLLAVFKSAQEDDLDKVSNSLAPIVNRKADAIKQILIEQAFYSVKSEKFTNRALEEIDTIHPFFDIISFMDRTRCTFDTVYAWIGRGDYQLDAVFPVVGRDEINKILNHKIDIVSGIKNALKAGISNEDWQITGAKLQDNMRTLQRDKLTDTLRYYTLLDNINPDFHAMLLLDPFVDSCMKTTRLKQAISSVQLFIHRILMGHEVGLSLSEDFSNQWEWKKNYRVWEAYRKVILFPENWIEPELRDNKSPFFKEFEDQLAQSELNDKSIEKAFKKYLGKLDEVGNLEVASFYEADGQLHVVGRTRETPHVYYYRYQAGDKKWTPWKRIDLDIGTGVVLLVVHNQIPHVFWPSIKHKVQKLGQDNPDDDNNDKTNYRPVMEITFNWSKYEDGRWTPKKKNDEPAILMYEWRYQELFEKPEEYLVYSANSVFSMESRSREIIIRVFILGLNSITIKKYKWDNEILDGIFDRISQLPSEVDWTYIYGNGIGPNANFSSNDVDLITRNVNVLTEAAKTNIEKTLFTHAFDFNSPSGSSFTGSFSTPFAIGLSNNLLFSSSTDLINYHERLSYWLISFPDSWANEKGGFGLEGNDKRHLLNGLNAIGNKSDPQIREELKIQDFFYKSLSIDSIDGENNLIQFSQIVFSGYKLKSRTTNTKGLDYSFSEEGGLIDRGLVSATGFNNNSINSQSIESFHFNYLKYEGHNLLFRIIKHNPSHPKFSLESFFFHQDHESYLLKNNRSGDEFSVERFYHPWTNDFNSTVHDNYVENSVEKFKNLLQLNRQFKEHKEGEEKEFPTTAINTVAPEIEEKRLSFDLTKPFGLYNWELFFHMPFTIATRLAQNKKYKEAQQWFHFIFNPLASFELPNDGSDKLDVSSKYWNFLPFHKNTNQLSKIEKIWGELDASSEMDALAQDPFNPHRIARTRIGAYQKAVVMKYLDNILEWADSLFARDTIESINEATHLYLVAAHVLGPQPKLLPKNTNRAIVETVDKLPAFGSINRNLMKQGELESQYVGNKVAKRGSSQSGLTVINQYYLAPPISNLVDEINEQNPVFTIPYNNHLLEYWDTVANRLFKIRNCRNIEGMTRELPIFEPPIDPGFLVRGRALGIDISELLSDLYAPLPHYRFRAMLQKAYEFCGDVRSLGGALLSALEKKDAEELSLLRAGHERRILKLTHEIKREQIRELNENLKATYVSEKMAEAKYEYYSSRKFANSNERKQVDMLNVGLVFNVLGQSSSAAASLAYAYANYHVKTSDGITIVEWGGRAIGDVLRSTADFLNMIGSIFAHQANLHSIQAIRERRWEDWQFQAQQAKKEIKQIKKQILATEIRISIAEKELSNHEQQQEHAEEIETFMRYKFTNQELYHWMISQVSTMYFQTYKMAIDLAKMTQHCYRYERGDNSATFIGGGYWDNLKKGLLAGEKLQFDLRRMEHEYLRKNTRELEITKHISLKALNPAELNLLRYKGKCSIQIPELLFDLDYPGHYYRRIKAMSISIPAIVGPYSGVNASLRLVESKTRKKANLEEGILPLDQAVNTNRIALSSGQNDSGLFELNYNDERYLPFELRGAVSTWELEFPGDLEQFDRSTISDVIIHMRYTARQGDQDFQDDVNRKVNDIYNGIKPPENLTIALDIRREFPNLWQQFLAGSEHKLALNLTKERLPYLLRPYKIGIREVQLFCAYDLKEASAEEKEVNKTKMEMSATSQSVTIELDKLTKSPAERYFFQSKKSPFASEDLHIMNNLTFSVTEGLPKNLPINKLKELIMVLYLTTKKQSDD